MKEVILTPEGYEKLKREIEELSTTRRREVAERIRIAREFGDIAENAEYDDAKNEQMLLEHRIATLEERMRDARVISKKDIAKDVVSVGSKVLIRVMQSSRGRPLISALQEPHLPALQFQRTARSWAWVACSRWMMSRTTSPSLTSTV